MTYYELLQVITFVLNCISIGLIIAINRNLYKTQELLLHVSRQNHLLTIKINTIMNTEQDFLDVLTRIDTATNNVAAELTTLKDEIKGQGLPAATESSILSRLQSLATNLETIGKPETPAGVSSSTGTADAGSSSTSTGSNG